MIHERRGLWFRQIRPRVVGWPVRVVESRSTSDLVTALDGTVCPLVVIDLGEWVRPALVDLSQAVRTSPGALVLVLDAAEHRGVVPIARELGATHVLTGVINPPDVMDLLARWIPLARRRAEADGWIGDPSPEPPIWEQLAAVER
jgi:hypothetical protein